MSNVALGEYLELEKTIHANGWPSLLWASACKTAFPTTAHSASAKPLIPNRHINMLGESTEQCDSESRCSFLTKTFLPPANYHSSLLARRHLAEQVVLLNGANKKDDRLRREFRKQLVCLSTGTCACREINASELQVMHCVDRSALAQEDQCLEIDSPASSAGVMD